MRNEQWKKVHKPSSVSSFLSTTTASYKRVNAYSGKSWFLIHQSEACRFRSVRSAHTTYKFLITTRIFENRINLTTIDLSRRYLQHSNFLVATSWENTHAIGYAHSYHQLLLQNHDILLSLLELTLCEHANHHLLPHQRPQWLIPLPPTMALDPLVAIVSPRISTSGMM